jgi:hypothetical protein
MAKLQSLAPADKGSSGAGTADGMAVSVAELLSLLAKLVGDSHVGAALGGVGAGAMRLQREREKEREREGRERERERGRTRGSFRASMYEPSSSQTATQVRSCCRAATRRRG